MNKLYDIVNKIKLLIFKISDILWITIMVILIVYFSYLSLIR